MRKTTTTERRTRYGAAVILGIVFTAGYLAGESQVGRPPRVFECSGDQLVGTLFTDQQALDVPGKMVLAWDSAGRKKLVGRHLFEVCAETK